MEVPTEALMHQFKLSRRRATLVVIAVCFVLGLPLAVNMGHFGSFVDLVTIYLYPLGVLFIVFVAQWIWGAENARLAINQGSAYPVGQRIRGLLKYVFVLVCLGVLILNVYFGGIG